MNKRKVLITGVNSGIGYAAALIFAKEGFHILGIDLADELSTSLLMKIKTLGGVVEYSKCNVANQTEVSSYFQSLDSEIDILVNNAGILGPRIKTESYPIEAFDEIVDVNIKGVFYLSKYALPYLKKHAGSSIINVASVAGLVGMTNHVAYSASKHAVVGMTKTMALEYAKVGIRVNAVCPGFTETSMVEKAQLEQEYIGGLKMSTPMKRFAEAEEIAAGIYYLASANASFMTGQCLILDGGLTAQ
jgi:NAD(P)-dependent dehydrogenase (short-subunit alcohol dehydrogenase family)